MPGEDLLLSKGSKKALQDKRLVSEIARELRYQSKLNPSVFPAGTYRTFRNMADQQVAEWFFSEIDKLEKAGYDGIKFSQDGANNDWLARKFINGAHNWEDIIGKFTQQMNNWYQLKKHNLLEPRHANIPSYGGLLELGYIMTIYYGSALKDLESKVELDKLRKNSKSLKVVDNDDYVIYTTLNRAANQLIGNGTVWCTTSRDKNNPMFDNYANQAMLFQLFPKNAETISVSKYGREAPITGKERYQFGADRGYSFMNIADIPVPKEELVQRFPYLYDDLTRALRQMKPEFAKLTKEYKEDPVLNSNPVLKIKEYNIDEEIKKLHGFVDRGKFTTQKRPQALENPEQPPESSSGQPPTQQNESSLVDDQSNLILKEEKMSNVDKDIAAMLNSLKKYDRLAKKSILKESSMPDFNSRDVYKKKEPVGLDTLQNEPAVDQTKDPLAQRRVKEFFDSLDPKDKQLVYMFFWKDMTPKQVSQATGISQARLNTFLRKMKLKFLEFHGITDPNRDFPGGWWANLPSNIYQKNRDPKFDTTNLDVNILSKKVRPEVDEMFDYSNPDSPMPDRPTHDELARRQAFADFEKSRGNSFMGMYGDEYKDRFKYGDFYDIAGPRGVLPEDELEEDDMEEGAGVMHFKKEQAQAAGKDSFTVGGKEFPVKEQTSGPSDEEIFVGAGGQQYKEEEEPAESPDQEVMEWMNRFNRLGRI